MKNNTKNLLRVTISGSFIAADKTIQSYDSVEGIIPALDDDKAQQMVKTRYARIWIGQAKDAEGMPLYPRVNRVREVFIDSIDDAEDMAGKPLSYVGKNIMEMSYEELQDLAAANDLAAVPLYKTGSLVTARRIAFACYAGQVLGWEEENEKGMLAPIDWRRNGFNPSHYEPILADGEVRRRGDAPATIEESIDREALSIKGGKAAQSATSGSRLTLNQLKAIADQKNVAYNANIGFEALYKKVYGKAA